MKTVLHLTVFLLLITCSCSSEKKGASPSKEIASRDGVITYVCDPLPLWEEIPSTNSLADSTLPIASWKIDNELVVAIHNFPGSSIPPQAQIARWEKQLKNADPTSVVIEPAAWGGFEGLKLFVQDTQDQSIMAWSMVLPVFHRYALSGVPREEHYTADWTIKVTGSTALMQEHEDSINAFAHSFRLKKDIP